METTAKIYVSLYICQAYVKAGFRSTNMFLLKILIGNPKQFNRIKIGMTSFPDCYRQISVWAIDPHRTEYGVSWHTYYSKPLKF